MTDLPILDVVGLTQLMTITLASLAVLWGINKAIQVAKN